MRFDAQVLVGPVLVGVGGGQALAAHGPHEEVELLAGYVRAARVGGAVVPERLPSAQGGFRRSAGDAEGDAAVGEQVEGGGFLGEVQRVPASCVLT